MALPAYANNAKTPAEHHEVYLDLMGSSQGKGIPASMMSAMKDHAKLIKLPGKLHAMLHKKITAHVNQLVRDDEISDDEASKVKAIYAPSTVKEGTEMELDEKKMTPAEMAKREKMVKSMKKNFASFKKRYGDRAKEVMYATATKQAMKSEEVAAEGYEERKNASGWHSDSQKNPNFNDELSNRRVNAVGKRLKSGKLSADESGSQERLKTLMKFKKERGGLTGPKGVLPEEQDVAEDQHYCAKHVYSEVFGEGLVVEGQHAEPDENGNIEWYTVQFEHGEEVIFTEDVEIMMAEYHANHSPAKKKKKAMKAE